VNTTVPEPLIKYPGRKTRIMPHILDHIGHVQGTYIEPFLGSAAVALALSASGRLHGPAVLSDVNPWLACLHRWSIYAPVILSDRLCEVDASHSTPEDYYALRDRRNEVADPRTSEHAAWTIWLNRAGFNGLFRENRSGGYNVPCGDRLKRGKALALPDVAAFLAVGEVLHDAQVMCRDWRPALDSAGDGDVVYCDPPYLPLKAGHDFAGYSAAGFRGQDHIDLANAAAAAAYRGARVLISNHDTPGIRELYTSRGGVISWQGSARRSMSCKASTRGQASELVAVFG
jgi:DNA adenine methylase